MAIKKVLVSIPEELIQAGKLAAVTKKKNFSEYVTSLIRKDVKIPEIQVFLKELGEAVEASTDQKQRLVPGNIGGRFKNEEVR